VIFLQNIQFFSRGSLLRFCATVRGRRRRAAASSREEALFGTKVGRGGARGTWSRRAAGGTRLLPGNVAGSSRAMGGGARCIFPRGREGSARRTIPDGTRGRGIQAQRLRRRKEGSKYSFAAES